MICLLPLHLTIWDVLCLLAHINMLLTQAKGVVSWSQAEKAHYESADKLPPFIKISKLSVKPLSFISIKTQH